MKSFQSKCCGKSNGLADVLGGPGADGGVPGANPVDPAEQMYIGVPRV